MSDEPKPGKQLPTINLDAKDVSFVPSGETHSDFAIGDGNWYNKPWYEKFEARGCLIYLEDGDELCMLRGPEATAERNEARAQLFAASSDMAQILLGEEWVDMREEDGEWYRRCLRCEGFEEDGHEPSCCWLAAMRRAGIRP